MKTPEEIEQLANKIYGNMSEPLAKLTAIAAFTVGYTQCQQDNAERSIDFSEWISDNGWIKDPLPQKGFSDNKIRYTNIANIDVHSDDKLLAYTIQELYEQFLTTLNKQ